MNDAHESIAMGLALHEIVAQSVVMTPTRFDSHVSEATKKAQNASRTARPLRVTLARPALDNAWLKIARAEICLPA
jgi:hypothetical protein